MKLVWMKRLARVFGNFGVSFFGPLVSGNVAESIYDIGLQFEQTIFIALLAATFQTGYVIFQEVREFGYSQEHKDL